MRCTVGLQVRKPFAECYTSGLNFNFLISVLLLLFLPKRCSHYRLWDWQENNQYPWYRTSCYCVLSVSRDFSFIPPVISAKNGITNVYISEWWRKRNVFYSRKVLWPAGVQLLWLEVASLLVLFTYLYVSASMMKVVTSNLEVTPNECRNNSSSWILRWAHCFTTEAHN